MSAWFRRQDHDASKESQLATDDAPTGQIPALSIADADAAGSAVSDRRALIELCLYAFDRARSEGVAKRLERGLSEVGVTAIRPNGARFDPALHEAGSTVTTDDATLDGVIAETEVVGFIDHGQLIRVPIVTVYTR